MLQKILPYNTKYRIINLIYNKIYYFIVFIQVSALTTRKHEDCELSHAGTKYVLQAYIYSFCKHFAHSG